MDAARREAEQGPAEPVVIRADTETAARGRLGRSWTAPPGGLWFTAAIPGLARRSAGPAALLAGLAVIEAARAVGLPKDLARLRWPNDILIDDRKLSGILGETFDSPAGAVLLLGVGINANLDPADLGTGLRTPPTTLREHLGRDVDLAHLLDAWIATLLADLAALDGSVLSVTQIDRLKAVLWRRDQATRVQDGERLHDGILCGIDADARLLIETGDGLKHLAAGECSVRDPDADQ